MSTQPKWEESIDKLKPKVDAVVFSAEDFARKNVLQHYLDEYYDALKPHLLELIKQVEHQTIQRCVEKLRRVVEDDDDARDALEEIINEAKLQDLR